ncbi:MAG: hypothetical protein IJY28_00615 [Clostridia bacterium]|nr:hypothetical protein [Clostridia bacterium]
MQHKAQPKPEACEKQKIAAGAATPTTIEKKNLLQADDTIIGAKCQVRPTHEMKRSLNHV